jgi:RimJ/RimL family protein N-acetyltransferase
MHEAAAAACAHAFGPLGQRRIEAEVDPDNRASCRLLEALGFRAEGRLRQRWTAKGRTYDTTMYGLLADGWVAPA